MESRPKKPLDLVRDVRYSPGWLQPDLCMTFIQLLDVPARYKYGPFEITPFFKLFLADEPLHREGWVSIPVRAGDC
jgi:hypothetical protein